MRPFTRSLAFVSPARPLVAGLSLVGLFATGCAKPAPAPATAAAIDDSESAEPPPSDALAVSGLRGTLSQHEIQGALEPRLPKLLRCVQTRLGALDVLSGRISFAFHIAVNGSVDAVRPTSSTLGDRETERCMLELAKSTRFPPPHGGEAEFVWPLEIPIDPDVRPPVELTPDFTQKPLASETETLHARCGGGQVVVTVYLDPDGQVLASGVAAPDLATPSELDCVAEGVRAWRFPSPGSYLGKLSFTLP